MPIAVAGIHQRGSSRRRLTSAWPAPMTSPATAPPSSAASGLSTRPATAVPAKPARGKARNPAVQSNQVRRKDVRTAAGGGHGAQLLGPAVAGCVGAGARRGRCRASAPVAAIGVRMGRSSRVDAEGGHPQSPAGAADQAGRGPTPGSRARRWPGCRPG